MIKKTCTPFVFFLLAQFCFAQAPSTYVDPFIGTGGHGHTFPGATMPFGMVQLSPDTRVDGSWDGCSGYHESDSLIYGFSHTHLSGTGCSDYGDIMLMPMMGNTSYDRNVYASRYTHRSEKAEPGYYAVKLDDDDIDASFTSTTRVGYHQYIFNKPGRVSVILDLNHRDKLLAGVIKVVNDRTYEVYRCSEAWAKSQKLYARITFSKAVIETRNPAEGEVPKSADPWNKSIKTAFVFNVKKGDTIQVKVAISPASMKGAALNMKEELPYWDFEAIRKEARKAWDKELGRIEVRDDRTDQKKIFYTALYHCMIHPSIAMDVDSMYRGMDDQVHKSMDHIHYSVFSLWDTFRALHPLFSMIDQKRTADFIKTFLAMYTEGGRLPVWELGSNETDCMIGYHSVSVIADAYMKGIRDFNAPLALEAMKKSATWKHLGIPVYMTQGYLGMDNESESVSKTLEYSYDDWCIAQLAHMLNKREDYVTYSRRAQNWKNICDRESGFMRPKENGNWISPFDPRRVDNNYTEANAWQYSFFVPQDVSGHIDFMGGYARYESKLDSLFSISSKTTGREQSDITGLIGQYAHGNEPSHHIAYLYNYIGKAWKTQQRVHQIQYEFYKATPDGLIGNEDCGQMSAWYVMSAMGFYAVTPGLPVYNIGTPVFKEVNLHLQNGNELLIRAKDVSDRNFYIQSASLGNADYSRSWIEHNDVMKGGLLEFQMGSAAQPLWAAETSTILSTPPSEFPVVPVPLIITEGKTFKDSTLVSMAPGFPGCRLFYTLDGTAPSDTSQEYKEPFSLDSTRMVCAVAMNEQGALSSPVKARVYKLPHPDWKVNIKSTCNPSYTAGGDGGIIDGLRGTTSWRKGDWQGYQAQDFEATVDMGKEIIVNQVGAGFLQDTQAWIVFPTKLVVEFSSDGYTFTQVAEILNTVPDKDLTTQVKDFVKDLPKWKARYVRLKAKNYGVLPAWHQGATGDAFIFIDELIIQ